VVIWAGASYIPPGVLVEAHFWNRQILFGTEGDQLGVIRLMLLVNALVVLGLWIAYRAARRHPRRFFVPMASTALVGAVLLAAIAWSGLLLARLYPPLNVARVFESDATGQYAIRDSAGRDASTAGMSSTRREKRLQKSPPVAREPAMRLPEDEAWLGALQVGGEVKRPEKVSGSDFDLYGHFGGRRHHLGVCFLGLIVDEGGRVERAYFLGPSDASDETREVFLSAVRVWRFSPATKDGAPVRVRHILSVSDCPYLPSESSSSLESVK
jgi:hypothetical protein